MSSSYRAYPCLDYAVSLLLAMSSGMYQMEILVAGSGVVYSLTRVQVGSSVFIESIAHWLAADYSCTFGYVVVLGLGLSLHDVSFPGRMYTAPAASRGECGGFVEG